MSGDVNDVCYVCLSDLHLGEPDSILTPLEPSGDEVDPSRVGPVQRQLRDGIRIALIGSVNVGKSLLFNAFLGKDRAIVTPQAGTTRDTIEAGVYRDGCYWTFVDTAGLRRTGDIIEQEGVERSRAEAQQADLILLVVDRSRKLEPDELLVYRQIIEQFRDKIIIVHNKIDLPSVDLHLCSDIPTLKVSARTGQFLKGVEQAIQGRVERLFAQADTPYMLNQRQFKLILGLEKRLAQVQEIVVAPVVAHELLAHHLTDAIAHISELTGKSISEAGLDAVFKQFCVGK